MYIISRNYWNYLHHSQEILTFCFPLDFCFATSVCQVIVRLLLELFLSGLLLFFSYRKRGNWFALKRGFELPNVNVSFLLWLWLYLLFSCRPSFEAWLAAQMTPMILLSVLRFLRFGEQTYLTGWLSFGSLSHSLHYASSHFFRLGFDILFNWLLQI